jgi:hypothetical protein
VLEDAHDLLTADVMSWDSRYCFMRRIVHDRQAFDRASAADTIEDEVHRSHFVGGLGPDQGLAICHRHLLTSPPHDLQLFLGIEPIDSLVVHALAGLPQLQVDHPGAVAPMAMRELHNPLA